MNFEPSDSALRRKQLFLTGNFTGVMGSIENALRVLEDASQQKKGGSRAEL